MFFVALSRFLQVLILKGSEYKQLISCLYSFSDFKPPLSPLPKARERNARVRIGVNTNSNRRDIFMTLILLPESSRFLGCDARLRRRLGYWVTELTLLIRSQFSLLLICYETCYGTIDKSLLPGIPKSFYGNLSEEHFVTGIQYICIENGQLWLVSLYVKNWIFDPRTRIHAIL